MRKTQEVITVIEHDLDEDKLSQRKIAEKHGVHHSYVGKVKRGLAKPLVTSARTEVPQVDPTDSKILQLEAKVIAITDERNRLNLAYKATQRENSIFEAMVDELHTTIKPITPLPKIIKIKPNGKQIKESVVLHFSDCHADSIIKPESVGGLEEFNFPIALRRAEQLVDTTIKFTQETLSNYDFGTLYVLANGDHISGEIHGAVNHSYYRNAFKNAIAVGQMQALMFRDLAPYFNQIKVVYVSGNHGRRTPKKDYQNPLNSWDYLVAEIAKQHCANLKNVDFLIPDSFSANIEIEGYGFCMFHGDDVRGWNGIPFYGLQRKTSKWTALNASVNRKVQYYVCGHFHQASSMANLDGEMLLNGAWTATDPYVYNAITSWGEPCQILHGVHKDRGISWRLHVKLRTKDEVKGPNRYGVLIT
jgi:hypothetical protein